MQSKPKETHPENYEHHWPKTPHYVALALDVALGSELICKARSHAMARRIAFALNRYREEYRKGNQ